MSGQLSSISVVIPAYRSAATITRAIASAAKQTLPPSQIIVVDDGSDDGTFETAEACRALCGSIDFRISQQENLGAGAARNKALKFAESEYVAFLDADDEWFPEKLERSMEQINRNDLVLIAHNGWIERNGEETYLDIAKRYQSSRSMLFHGFYKRGFISTSSVVVRRYAIVDAGGFDTDLRIGQDFDLWLRLIDRFGPRCLVFDQPLTRYHITEGSITSQTRSRLRHTLRIAIRHFSGLRRHPGSAIGSLGFRVLALHWEALSVHLAKRHIVSAATTILLLPLNLIEAISDELDRNGPADTSRWQLAVNLGLSIWVIAVLAGYLQQFSWLVEPVLRRLGLI